MSISFITSLFLWAAIIVMLSGGVYQGAAPMLNSFLNHDKS